MNFARGSHFTNREHGRNKFYRGRPLPKTTGFFGQGWSTFNNEKIEIASHYKSTTATDFETPNTSSYTAPPRVTTVPNNTTGRSTSSACPRSSSSNSPESHVILAITEGRGTARGEVGLAAVDLRRPHLVVCQLNDNFSYTETLTKIYLLNPSEIIVPHTFYDGPKAAFIYKTIKENFPNTLISAVQRNLFSDIIGTSFIDRICAVRCSSVKILLSKKFYALAAAGAVLRYVEILQSILFAPLTVKVEYQGNNDSLLIDFETAIRLELVASLSNKNKKASLLGCINHCVTTIGKRTLRANILQPFSDIAIISKRQNVVEELIEKPQFLQCLKGILVHFSEVNKLCTLCTLQNTSVGNLNLVSDTYLNQILLLKTCISFIPSFRDAILEAEADYFAEARELLIDSCWKIMENEILNIIHSDSFNTKGAGGYAQRCFAVKPKLNGLLDIARKAYTEKVDEVRAIVQGLSSKYELNLRTNYHANKGFHIVMKLNRWDSKSKLPELPSCFIVMNRGNMSITMTTQELIAVNAVLKEVKREIQLMSNIVISGLLTSMRNYISAIYALIDVVGELDVLQSLATVSSAPSYVRPTFGEIFLVAGGVHPILEYFSDVPLVANDIRATSLQNFFLITGANMSGKSTFIKQIAIQHILAQIGCYIPATEAQFRIVDRIFSRIYFEDSIETNASSYVLEMREMQYILEQITPCSLVIIDELCRGTSMEEGIALAWAICEHLAQLKFDKSKNTRNYKIPPKPFIFFTTHYMKLTEMYLHYYNITNLYLEVVEEKSKNGRERLKYTHQLKIGINPVKGYSLKLAKATSLPPSVIKDAEELLKELEAKEEAQSVQNDMTMNTYERMCYEFGATLLTFDATSMLTQEVLEQLYDELMANTDLVSKMDILEAKFANVGNYHSPAVEDADLDSPSGEYQNISCNSSSILAPTSLNDEEMEDKMWEEIDCALSEFENGDLTQSTVNELEDLDNYERTDMISQKSWTMNSLPQVEPVENVFNELFVSPSRYISEVSLIRISSQATTILNSSPNDADPSGFQEDQYENLVNTTSKELPSRPKPLINIITNETFTEDHPQFKNVQKVILENSQQKSVNFISSQALLEEINSNFIIPPPEDFRDLPENNLPPKVKGKRTTGLPIKSSRIRENVTPLPSSSRGSISASGSNTTTKDESSSGTATTIWFENIIKSSNFNRQIPKIVQSTDGSVTLDPAVKNAKAFVSDPSEYSF